MSKRAGNSIITSVSVSKEFKEFLMKYNLSPTEVFRKGVAVSLCELGEKQYETELNNLRCIKSKLVLKELETINKLREQLKIITGEDENVGN